MTTDTLSMEQGLVAKLTDIVKGVLKITEADKKLKSAKSEENEVNNELKALDTIIVDCVKALKRIPRRVDDVGKINQLSRSANRFGLDGLDVFNKEEKYSNSDIQKDLSKVFGALLTMRGNLYVGVALFGKSKLGGTQKYYSLIEKVMADTAKFQDEYRKNSESFTLEIKPREAWDNLAKSMFNVTNLPATTDRYKHVVSQVKNYSEEVVDLKRVSISQLSNLKAYTDFVRDLFAINTNLDTFDRESISSLSEIDPSKLNPTTQKTLDVLWSDWQAVDQFGKAVETLLADNRANVNVLTKKLSQFQQLIAIAGNTDAGYNSMESMIASSIKIATCDFDDPQMPLELECINQKARCTFEEYMTLTKAYGRATQLLESGVSVMPGVGFCKSDIVQLAQVDPTIVDGDMPLAGFTEKRTMVGVPQLAKKLENEIIPNIEVKYIRESMPLVVDLLSNLSDQLTVILNRLTVDENETGLDGKIKDLLNQNQTVYQKTKGIIDQVSKLTGDDRLPEEELQIQLEAAIKMMYETAMDWLANLKPGLDRMVRFDETNAMQGTIEKLTQYLGMYKE